MKTDRYSCAFKLGLSLLFVCSLFAWQGDKGFSLGDEGFLWYGSQRVMMGEVPIRDFMAYDPGRYYWSAGLMGLFGDDGIMSLRASVAVFQVMGLFVGLTLISRYLKSESRDNIPYLFVSAAILVLWMYPRHKLFDISLSIFLIGILTFLIEKPIAGRYFITGFCVGFIAVFGRNHGVYGALGSLAAIVWLAIKSTENSGFVNNLSLWAGGMVAGFVPIFLMLLAIPGFAVAFWDSILFLFEQNTTNLPVPIPWPWMVEYSSVSFGDGIRGLLIGLFFIGILAYGFLAIASVFLRKIKAQPVPSAMAATAFLALPYSHFAFSRADLGHLAQGVFPLLMGVLIFLSTRTVKIKWFLVLAFFAGGVWIMHTAHPGWQCLSKKCVEVEISGSIIQVRPPVARDIELLHHLAERFAGDGQGFVAVPSWPGAYPLLERRAPMWEIYALWPRLPQFEREEIERIRSYGDLGFVIVLDAPLDGRDDLRFKYTHPLTYRYILDTFERIPISSVPGYEIYGIRGVNP